MSLVLVLGSIGIGLWGWTWFGPRGRWESALRRAEADLAAGRLSLATEQLRSLILERPDAPRPRLLWAEGVRRLGRLDDAINALDAAIAAGLTADEGRRTYALIFAATDFARAEGSLRRVLRDNPGDVEAHHALADGLLRSKRWKGAAEAASAWLVREPDSTAARLIRARASWESAHWPEAEADFRAVLIREPENFPARIQLADCLLNDAKLAEAEPELIRCRTLAPARPEPLVGLAAVAVERGETDRAEALLDEALHHDPDFVPALADRARLHIAARDDAAARPLLERAVRLQPNHEALRFLLGQVVRRTQPTPTTGEPSGPAALPTIKPPGA